MSSRFSHIVPRDRAFFFGLKQSNVCINHISCIHYSVDGHLGYSFLLATVNNDVVDLGTNVRLRPDWFLLSMQLEAELLDHMWFHI